MVHQYLWAVTNVSCSEDCNAALVKLRLALDETFGLLKRLTGQTEAQQSRLHSLSPPDGTGPLAFVLAVLRHNLMPSEITGLVKSLQDMRIEIQMCLKKLDTVFQHSWRLYTAMSNGLARVQTNESTFSTSTTLPARINLVDWLKDREDIWGISRQRNRATTVSIVVIWNVTHLSILVVLWDSLRIEQVINGDQVAPNTLDSSLGVPVTGPGPQVPAFGSTFRRVLRVKTNFKNQVVNAIRISHELVVEQMSHEEICSMYVPVIRT